MFATVMPYELQYFDKYQSDTSIIIPCDDAEAYQLYPQYRWLYNKLRICETQYMPAFPLGVNPAKDDFPIVTKPITNIFGGAAGVHVYDTFESFSEWRDYRPGHFWMPKLVGPTYSSDFAVLHGTILYSYTQEASVKLSSKGGLSIWKWTVAELPFSILDYVSKWVKNHLPDYNGILNIDTVGAAIIECHPRICPECPDLNGPGYLDAVVKLYKRGIWNYKNEMKTGAQYYVLHPSNGMATVDMDAVESLKKEVSSIQLCWIPGVSLADGCFYDGNNYRIAQVNGFDEAVVARVTEALRKLIVIG